MTVEPQIVAELQELRAEVRQLHGSLVAGADGLVVAHDLADLDPDGLAALTAAAVGLATRLTDAAGRGGFEESLTRGEQGYVAAYRAGRSAVVTAIAGAGTNVGRLQLCARRTAERVGALVDE
ncbi:roadblock/LC7 domain-containing protein [Streptomyces sulphureus]|uniref:roadblock/LC7 domain-containing protein n=2 Tax=Streptomyces TaxID=1883 RepID=UPI0003743A2B|nr:roadblock/LC7 domain-containing protein [Streptomyces sulphureus]